MMVQMEDFALFSKRLKQSIDESGYTQVELAKNIGISKHSLTKYLSGRIPEATILYSLAKFLGKSMEWLLTGENNDVNITNKSIIVEESFELSETSIKERLIELRKLLGLSQAKFAKILGISAGNIANWESGNSLPGALALKNITHKLGCSADWILNGTPDKKPDLKPKSKNDLELDKMLKTLTKLMQDPNPDLRVWAKVQFEKAFGNEMDEELEDDFDEKKLHA